eukprot:gene4626-6799_t
MLIGADVDVIANDNVGECDDNYKTSSWLRVNRHKMHTCEIGPTHQYETWNRCVHCSEYAEVKEEKGYEHYTLTSSVDNAIFCNFLLHLEAENQQLFENVPIPATSRLQPNRDNLPAPSRNDTTATVKTPLLESPLIVRLIIILLQVKPEP